MAFPFEPLEDSECTFIRPKARNITTKLIREFIPTHPCLLFRKVT